jgi:hypothetical protein
MRWVAGGNAQGFAQSIYDEQLISSEPVLQEVEDGA